jgi:hypothetical protein
MLFALARGLRRIDPPQMLGLPAVADAWRQYKADLTISVVYRLSDDDRSLEEYTACLAAELIDNNCLALYHPASRRAWPADESLRKRLRSDASWAFHSGVD